MTFSGPETMGVKVLRVKWVDMGAFSRFSGFWLFSMKSVNAERDLRAVITQVGSVDPRCNCDSKSAPRT